MSRIKKKWSPHKMQFKEPNLKYEFLNSPIFLQMIVQDFCLYSEKQHGIEPMITRVLEQIDGSSGVHEDYRAVDIRDQFGPDYTYTEDQKKDLLSYINNRYYRNDGKLTMIHHSFKGAPYHFHIQISQLTKVYMRQA